MIKFLKRLFGKPEIKVYNAWEGMMQVYTCKVKDSPNYESRRSAGFGLPVDPEANMTMVTCIGPEGPRPGAQVINMGGSMTIGDEITYEEPKEEI